MRRHPIPAVDPAVVPYVRFESVVRAGFAHRRKMLRRCLDGLVRPEAFDALGIRSTARAEELSLGEWERLAAWGNGRSGPDQEAGDPAPAGGPSR